MNKSTVDHQVKTTSFLPPVQGILQRKCACGTHTPAGKECSKCSEKAGTSLQHSAISSQSLNEALPIQAKTQQSDSAGIHAGKSDEKSSLPSVSCSWLQDRSGAPSSAAGQEDGTELDIAGGFGSLVGPPQFDVTASTSSGPTFSSCRGFNLVVDWATTGSDGFIVQEITNTDSINRCDGTSVPGAPNTPHYWEAWPVVSGAIGDGGADLWRRGARPGTKGSWAMDSKVGLADALDPAAGFSRTAVPDANGLLATTTDPTNLYPATLSRHRGGVWDCCNGNNSHTAA